MICKTQQFTLLHLTWILAGLCIAVTPARAQTDSTPQNQSTDRHRHLELPDPGRDNVLLQYQMMQQLRSLASRSQNPPAPSDGPTWLADMMQDVPLDKMLKNLPSEDLQQLSELIQPDLANSDLSGLELPDSLLEHLKRPEVLQNPQIQKLLQQLADDGKLPSGQGFPLTNTPGLENRPNRQPPRSPQTRAPQPRAPYPKTLQLSQNHDRQAPSQLRPNNPANAPRQSNRYARNLPRPTNNPAGQQSNPAGQPRQTQVAPPTRPIQSDQFDPDALNRALSSLPPGLRSQVQRRAETRNRPQANPANPMDQHAAASLVQQVLEQGKRDPSQLPPLDDILSQLSQHGGISRQAYPAGISDRLKQMVPNKLKRQVEGKGLGKTLKALLSEANRQVRSGDDSKTLKADPGLFAGLEKSVLNAIGEVSQDLLKKPKKDSSENNAEGQTKTNNASRQSNLNNRTNHQSASSGGSRASTGPSSQSTTGQSSKNSKSSGFFKSASKYINSLVVDGNKSKSTGGSASSPSTAASHQDKSWQYSSPIALLLVFAAGVAAWLLWKWRAPDIGLKQRLNSIQVGQIRNDSDVVQAFHVIAGQSGRPAELWWTHQRAATELAAFEPGTQFAWTTLAELYERARYCTRSAPLSDTELSEARQAIRRLQT